MEATSKTAYVSRFRGTVEDLQKVKINLESATTAHPVAFVSLLRIKPRKLVENFLIPFSYLEPRWCGGCVGSFHRPQVDILGLNACDFVFTFILCVLATIFVTIHHLLLTLDFCVVGHLKLLRKRNICITTINWVLW